jgi:hypothetical protein
MEEGSPCLLSKTANQTSPLLRWLTGQEFYQPASFGNPTDEVAFSEL